MNIIPCSLHCKFQKEGYCNLDHTTKVNSISERCAYYVDRREETLEALTEIKESAEMPP